MPQEWPRYPMNAQPNIPDEASAQLQERPLPQIPRRHNGSGLLSNWKAAQRQLQQGQQGQQINPAPNIATTSTPPHPHEPITGPTYHQQNIQSFMAAPISPHQSGVSQVPVLFNGVNGTSGAGGASGQTLNLQQGPNTQNVLPFHQSPQRQEPNTQNVLPFHPQQPLNGPSVQTAPTDQPFNPASQSLQPLVVEPQTMPEQPDQPFGPHPVPGQPQNPWQQGQLKPLEPFRPMGPTYGGLPPGMTRPGSGGQGGKGSKGSKKKSRKKKRRFPIWARVVVGVLVFLLILTGSGYIYYQVNFATAVNNITNQQVTRIHGEDNPNTNRDSTNILNGGRLNILLLGSDTDQKFAGVFLSQTDIVVTINPQTGSVAMVSIPRDTWLHAAENGPAADNGMMKLDQTYGRGGIANTRATIEQDFGIPINYYAWVGLDGFIKVIDTVGGIDVDVLHPITDDNYPDDVGNKDAYAYKRLDLASGPQHLDGPTALEYVRSRHADLVGDFGRSVRQQQILSQLKTKLQNPGIIGQLPTLASDLNGFVKTDMALPQVFQLMNFARTINQSTIKQVILDGTYSRVVNSYSTSYGPQDIVVLNCGTVQPLIAQLFALGNNARCNTGISYNGTPQQIASVSPHPTPAIVLTTTDVTSTADIWQTVSQMTSLGTMKMNDGTNDLFGIHSLLDLLCFVTFETPSGLQA